MARVSLKNLCPLSWNHLPLLRASRPKRGSWFWWFLYAFATKHFFIIIWHFFKILHLIAFVCILLYFYVFFVAFEILQHLTTLCIFSHIFTPCLQLFILSFWQFEKDTLDDFGWIAHCDMNLALAACNLAENWQVGLLQVTVQLDKHSTESCNVHQCSWLFTSFHYGKSSWFMLILSVGIKLKIT